MKFIAVYREMGDLKYLSKAKRQYRSLQRRKTVKSSFW